MWSKQSARHSPRGMLPSPLPAGPLPEAEQRLRAAFPEVWERYEWLVTSRAVDKRERAHVSVLVSRQRKSF